MAVKGCGVLLRARQVAARTGSSLRSSLPNQTAWIARSGDPAGCFIEFSTGQLHPLTEAERQHAHAGGRGSG